MLIYTIFSTSITYKKKVFAMSVNTKHTWKVEYINTLAMQKKFLWVNPMVPNLSRIKKFSA